MNGSPSGAPQTDDSPSRATSHMREIAQGKSYRNSTTINMLPDNVLLEIFDHCREECSLLDALQFVWDWHFLVHICQRWRQIIFESPLRLNLRILCTYGTPVRKDLGIWPAFPIVMDYANYDYGTGIFKGILPHDEDNVIAALEHPDRVSYLGLSGTGSQLDKMATVAREPFPVLMSLYIHSEDGTTSVLPAEFLGGSAPRLIYIELDGIPFPTLPTLLLSASNLIWLRLFDIPPTGYFAPKAMVTCLAVLPKLNRLVIEFQSTFHPDRIGPPPVTRIVLPALTFFGFKGSSEYLEDLVAQIDSPRLDQIRIDYLNQFVGFQVPQLSKFIGRSVGPKLALFRHARVTFFDGCVAFDMDLQELRASSYPYRVSTNISCHGTDQQVSHMAQVLSHVSAILSNVDHLELAVTDRDSDTYPEQLEGTDDIAWPHLLRQFSNVQTLHVSRGLAGHVALALEDITGEMAAGIFPSLDSVYLEGQPASSIWNFVTARQLSDRPITVVNTKMEFDERLKSYVSE